MSALVPSVQLLRSSGSIALVTRLVPSTFTSNIHAQSSGSLSSIDSRAARATRVVDEGVHRAECVDEGCERIHVVLLRDVGDEHVGTGLGGKRLEAVGPARDRHDVPAVRAQQAHRCLADARTRPRDHHSFVPCPNASVRRNPDRPVRPGHVW